MTAVSEELCDYLYVPISPLSGLLFGLPEHKSLDAPRGGAIRAEAAGNAMKLNLTRQQRILFLLAFLGFAAVSIYLWFEKRVVTRTDAEVLVAELELYAPISAVNRLHDDAIIRHHDGSGSWTETAQQYKTRILAGFSNVVHGTPYSYEDNIVGIETDWLKGTAVVDLNCRMRYGNGVRFYQKVLTLAKRNGKVCIVKRESIVQRDEILGGREPETEVDDERR